MNAPRVWIRALVIVLLAGWRLSNPPVVEAGTEFACDRQQCLGTMGQCEDGAFECAECPGYSCLGYGHFPCPFSYSVYCHAIE